MLSLFDTSQSKFLLEGIIGNYTAIIEIMCGW